MAIRKQQNRTVCVYCGASSNVSDIYKDAAYECGKMLAQNGIDVVYGGGRVGLMGIVADAALEHGGNVIGIIPGHLQKKEPKHMHLTELIIVESMHDRKALMEQRSDGFLVLPGGFGTMDETFEILTWKMIGLHNKDVVLLNTTGYWDPFIALADKIISEGFAQEKDRGFITMNSMDAVISHYGKASFLLEK
ncbi:MAG: TIGR00730 family Rossman fold protein [Pseudomonadota bacterium]|jgi:hypothetical protein|nr:TIGR00730 family Rossman fold protein [Pseudomonadota bacterium]QKK05823.1 MAG: TIGR00730 family Rossman fold protein [Pseudomonadota bacterium]|tara:strand:- start:838 stop:1413 length:576 start_codon:yes stop_codon:yes gene_type:complete